MKGFSIIPAHRICLEGEEYSKVSENYPSIDLKFFLRSMSGSMFRLDKIPAM
jgi:hypothetical protein